MSHHFGTTAMKMNTKNMKQVANRVNILINLFLQLGLPLGATLESRSDTNRPIMERLSFGKMWNIYIKANIFDIVVHTFRIRIEDSNAMSIPLHDVVTQMGRFKISRYPCQSLNISFNGSIIHDAIHKKGISQLELGLVKSKLCGRISRSFGFIAPSIIAQERRNDGLTWLWEIHVNRHFIVNVTFLSLEARFYPPCITRRALIKETRHIDLSKKKKRILGVFCPNNPPQSFYSSGNNVEIKVYTWDIFEDFFWKNYYFNQWIGKVSFTYEVLDNNLSLDPWKLLDRRWASEKFFHHYSELTSDYPRTLPSFHVTESLNNEANAYLFHFFQSSGEIVFVFYFQSHLGATIAIREGSLTCTKTHGSLVAYEGPIMDMKRIEYMLLRLQEWNCGHYMKAANREEELKGRIGDMTILFLVEKQSKNYFYSLTLKVAHRAIQRNTRFALNEKFYLETSSNINFEQNGTYFYSIDIQSAKTGFVSIYFDHISLRGYTDQTCTYGGLYFTNHAEVYNGYKSFVGAMCSQNTATRFQRLYGRDGLTFNHHVVIYIKQYYLLFLAHVKLRFSLDQCLGLYNPRVGVHSSFVAYRSDERGHVEIIWGMIPFYGLGSNFYYRWNERNYGALALSFVGIKRRNGTTCYKANYVNYDTISDVADRYFYEWMELENLKAVVGTGRMENVRPSRMSMAFYNIDDELKQFDKCLANAFRFFPDNQNNEPYVLITAPEEDAWVTLAFAAKFALDKICLIFGGAYQFRVQEAFGYSQCFSEVGGYLYDAVHPIIPKGVCGGILVNLHFHLDLSFQRPLIHARCCHLNILVMSKSIPCIRHVTAKRITLLQTEEIRGIYVWSNQIRTTSEMITWRVLCTKNSAQFAAWIRLPGQGFSSSLVENCIDVMFDVWETCDMTVHYRMSLLPLAYKAITTHSVFSQWMCRSNSCYDVRIMDYAISWDGAHVKCMKLNGSLVSVNSDAEWAYLTHNIILQREAYIELIYIGYRTVSNPSHNDCTFCNNQLVHPERFVFYLLQSSVGAP